MEENRGKKLMVIIIGMIITVGLAAGLGVIMMKGQKKVTQKEQSQERKIASVSPGSRKNVASRKPDGIDWTGLKLPVSEKDKDKIKDNIKAYNEAQYPNFTDVYRITRVSTFRDVETGADRKSTVLVRIDYPAKLRFWDVVRVDLHDGFNVTHYKDNNEYIANPDPADIDPNAQPD